MYCPNGVECTYNPSLCPGQCDTPRAYCADGTTDCTDDPSICPGECRSSKSSCTSDCTVPVCGDSIITDSTTSVNVWDCSGFDNRCGDGVVDPDGPDNTPNTIDDEDCDDGNLVN